MTQTNEGPGPLPGESGPTQSVNSIAQVSAAGPPFYSSDSVLAAAVQYAGRGWPVLPVQWVMTSGVCSCQRADCAGPGKHPLTAHGVNDATTDLEVIQRWWPKANVGIATGAVSGLVVVDIDPRHGGDGTLDHLLEEHGRLPDTVEVLTGGGGRHLYFAHPGGRVLSKTIAPGVDVKGDGGYVVAPPSVHASGRRYEWEASSLPGMVPVASLPRWLADLVAEKPGDGLGFGSDGPKRSHTLAGVSEGQRGDAVFKLAARCRRLGNTFDEALVLAIAKAQACAPPYPERLTAKAVASAYGRYRGPENDGDGDDLLDRPRRRILWGDGVEQLPPPEWLVDEVLVRGSLAVLYGEPGLGKSFVAVDLAGCVAAGLSWHGREVRQGRVIYIAAEGVGDLGLRVSSFRATRDGLSLPNLGFILEPINLFDGQGSDLAAQLLEELADDRPVLIIFDTLARSMDGGDESSARDMGRVVADLDRVRHATGATVLVVHHPGHDPRRERGSSALKGAADTFLRLTGEGMDLVLTCEKQKTASAFPSIPLKLHQVGDSLALVVEKVAHTLTSTDRSALQLVPAEGITNSAWQKAFRETGLGAKSTFDRRVRELVQKGAVVKKGQHRGALYHLTDFAKKALGVTGVN
jgi:hypothetical protein